MCVWFAHLMLSIKVWHLNRGQIPQPLHKTLLTAPAAVTAHALGRRLRLGPPRTAVALVKRRVGFRWRERFAMLVLDSHVGHLHLEGGEGWGEGWG